jgi:predicted anti-sigma-YlaC factor YlaD
MNGHLSDQQWAAVVLNESDEAAALHLTGCPSCRKELEAFAASASVAQTLAHKAADQPEAFWRRQREGIGARIAAREFVYPWKRWVWAATMVMLILLASTLLSRNNAPPQKSAAQPDADDALLQSVQESIQSDLPQALRPAALLTQEIGRRHARSGSP